MFVARIFRTFALLTKRNISYGKTQDLDIDADIILDDHSEINPDHIPDVFGIHIIRDPRDLLVSGALYHLKSDENWLRIPREDLNGNSYQACIKAMTSIEDVILFELEHAASASIDEMLNWDCANPQIRDLKYEDLVSERGGEIWNEMLESFSLPYLERYLLMQLFEDFKIGGRWVARKHIRNPEPGQWRQHFTPKIEKRFYELFPCALEQLGYR